MPQKNIFKQQQGIPTSRDCSGSTERVLEFWNWYSSWYLLSSLAMSLSCIWSRIFKYFCKACSLWLTFMLNYFSGGISKLFSSSTSTYGPPFMTTASESFFFWIINPSIIGHFFWLVRYCCFNTGFGWLGDVVIVGVWRITEPCISSHWFQETCHYFACLG